MHTYVGLKLYDENIPSKDRQTRGTLLRLAEISYTGLRSESTEEEYYLLGAIGIPLLVNNDELKIKIYRCKFICDEILLVWCDIGESVCYVSDSRIETG